jgi:putative FmdB family regulatory protein
MPTYRYKCDTCGSEFEVEQRISYTDEPHSCARCACNEYVPADPQCVGKVARLIGSTSFILKGPGWFKDGY